jgi:hypothetical protein
MGITEITNAVASFSRENPLVAGAIGLVLLLLLWRKPKLFFGLLLLSALLVVALSLIMDVSSVGRDQKKKLIEKGQSER